MFLLAISILSHRRSALLWQKAPVDLLYKSVYSLTISFTCQILNKTIYRLMNYRENFKCDLPALKLLFLFTLAWIFVNFGRSLTDQQVKDMGIKMLPGYSDPYGKRWWYFPVSLVVLSSFLYHACINIATLVSLHCIPSNWNRYTEKAWRCDSHKNAFKYSGKTMPGNSFHRKQGGRRLQVKDTHGMEQFSSSRSPLRA